MIAIHSEEENENSKNTIEDEFENIKANFRGIEFEAF